MFWAWPAARSSFRAAEFVLVSAMMLCTGVATDGDRFVDPTNTSNERPMLKSSYSSGRFRGRRARLERARALVDVPP